MRTVYMRFKCIELKLPSDQVCQQYTSNEIMLQDKQQKQQYLLYAANVKKKSIQHFQDKKNSGKIRVNKHPNRKIVIIIYCMAL